MVFDLQSIFTFRDNTDAGIQVYIFFVFGALVGYAYLLWKKKKSCLKKKKIRKECEEMRKFRQMKKDDFRGRVDDVFLVVFPIMFLIFNLLYWPLCLQTEVSSNHWLNSHSISYSKT